MMKIEWRRRKERGPRLSGPVPPRVHLFRGVDGVGSHEIFSGDFPAIVHTATLKATAATGRSLLFTSIRAHRFPTSSSSLRTTSFRFPDPISASMVPKKAPSAAAKGKQAAAGSSSSGQLEPSHYLNLEILDKVKLLLADGTNE